MTTPPLTIPPPPAPILAWELTGPTPQHTDRRFCLYPDGTWTETTGCGPFERPLSDSQTNRRGIHRITPPRPARVNRSLTP